MGICLVRRTLHCMGETYNSRVPGFKPHWTRIAVNSPSRYLVVHMASLVGISEVFCQWCFFPIMSWQNIYLKQHFKHSQGESLECQHQTPSPLRRRYRMRIVHRRCIFVRCTSDTKRRLHLHCPRMSFC